MKIPTCAKCSDPARVLCTEDGTETPLCAGHALAGMLARTAKFKRNVEKTQDGGHNAPAA